METTPFTAVVFDLGGVLIDWDPRYLYRQMFSDPVEMEAFLATVCSPAWNDEQDAGRPLAEATAQLVAQHPRHAAAIEAYYGRLGEMFSGPIAGSVALLRELQQAGQHRLYALPNWSHETFPYAQRTFDFLAWFEGIVVSGEERRGNRFRLFTRLCYGAMSLTRFIRCLSITTRPTSVPPKPLDLQASRLRLLFNCGQL